MTNAVITGWGKCTPPARLTNEHLATFLDTSDDWITSRTGIKERRIAHVPLSEMAEVAARQALACAGLQATDVDMLILATASPDTLIPSAASKLQLLLGAKNAGVMDLNAACTGFLYALSTAKGLIAGGDYETVLIIGADKLTWYLNWTERDTAVLFGDAAGAAVVQASDAPGGILKTTMGCDAKGNETLKLAGYGTTDDRYAGPKGQYEIQFDGREIFKRAVVGMGRASKRVMQAMGWEKSDLDLVIPHQANLRIIEALIHKLDVPKEKVVINIQHYGNTSAATIPLAMTEALEQGRIKPHDNILMAAFGAGLTWGAVALEWGDRIEPLAISDASLPPCDKTGLDLLGEAIAHCQRLQSTG
jgi:3-oxoacyl-[acyl-carrier-protein] synthase-3